VLLFVVGEERGSDGAGGERRRSSSRYLINGEPTAIVSAWRRAGSSASGCAPAAAPRLVVPERGESAIDKLIDTLVALDRFRCLTTRCSAARITASA
jgi:hypothetical protein